MLNWAFTETAPIYLETCQSLRTTLGVVVCIATCMAKGTYPMDVKQSFVWSA